MYISEEMTNGLFIGKTCSENEDNFLLLTFCLVTPLQQMNKKEEVVH